MLFDDRYADVDEPTVRRLFGADFARAVLAMTPGTWSGPVRSSYGLHLVRVTDLRQAEALRFDVVRDAVSNDRRRERERDTKAAYLAKLRDKYRVAAGPGGTEGAKP